MTIEKVDTLVVGAGQAGVALSEHLSDGGVPHLVLERHRIAERWRSERWDSLVANGPAWHDRFPNLEFSGVDADAFASKDRVADYFAEYAEQIAAPIRTGVEVTSVRRNVGRPGFCAETSDGTIDATYVVAATGAFQRPVIPAVVPADAGPLQLHSSGYRNPGQLPDGAVLVVGAGSSGMQIADELLRAGRRVFLSVGPHDRPPRRYRGRAGVASIIWATGFAPDYAWLQVDAFDERGRPRHRRGVSSEPGVYFLGLPWLSRRGSSFIWGVWHDAKYLADHIATQRGYLAYRSDRPAVTEP